MSVIAKLLSSARNATNINQVYNTGDIIALCIHVNLMLTFLLNVTTSQVTLPIPVSQNHWMPPIRRIAVLLGQEMTTFANVRRRDFFLALTF